MRNWATVILLLAAATLCGAALDPYVTLTSQAMVYVLVIVIAAYKLDWVPSALCAVGAVTALNFFFVPPRWTFEVDSQEHLIVLAVMLVVSLVISRLATGMRRESGRAAISEQRARQLQALATALAMAEDVSGIAALGQHALDAEFAGPNQMVMAGGQPTSGIDAGSQDALPEGALDGLRSCMAESAVLGPGTGRWPGLNAWYLPLGDQPQVMGAACVRPALAADVDGREHAQALCALLGQALWRVRLAATVQAAHIEAQRQQLQSTFLAAVSHDLRTPLASIVGAASSLQTQRDKLSQAEQNRLLGSIASEASYLATLTDNTLQLVRLTSLQQALRRDWESLEEIVGAVLARLRQGDPGRRIKSKVPAGLPLVKADPVLLAQLISNLLDNALTYSPGDIDLVVGASGHGVTIAVKDRGPGIADADLAIIFEPYQRGDKSGPRGARGAGLGLALCRAIALAHGGSLTVQRRHAGGSNFTVSLPLTEPQPHPEVP